MIKIKIILILMIQVISCDIDKDIGSHHDNYKL